ncbi:MAG TPA: peptidylprolyl isomerase [Pseudolabrys sp.]|nr:peptidylprolyl isomerase [Pseudolabrys sp.]
MSISFLAGSPALVRRSGLVLAAAAMLALAAGPLAAQDNKDKDPVVAKVNGAEIHESDLTLVEDEAGQLPPMTAEAKRDYLINFTADMLLLAQQAEKEKIGDTDLFKHRLALLRNKLLMETLLKYTGKQALTDEAMHKVYDEAVKQMKPEEEVHARHILIRAAAGDEKASKQAEDKIKAIIDRLKKGEDFAKVASETTEDPSGKANGGDLGYFTKDQMVPEFAEVAFKLDKGQISGPVKTQFGWHVIKVEDKRNKPTPTFNEVKPQIENYVTRKAQAELVTKLRAEGKVERMDKPADTAKPAPAAPAVPEKK